MNFDDDPRLSDLDLDVVTITIDGEGTLSLDSDLPAAETVWVLMDAIEYLRHPEGQRV